MEQLNQKMQNTNIKKHFLESNVLQNNVWVSRYFFITSCFLFFLLAGCLYSYAAEPVNVVNKESKLYKEILPIAIDFKSAITGKDIDKIIFYSNPNPRFSFARYLKDKSSEEYKYLFDSEWNEKQNPSRYSVYDVLSGGNIEIYIEKYQIKKQLFIKVYYYNSKKIKFPISKKKYLTNWGKTFHFCIFSKTDLGWKCTGPYGYGTELESE